MTVTSVKPDKVQLALVADTVEESVPLSDDEKAEVVESLMKAMTATELKTIWNKWSKSLDEKIKFEGETLTIRTVIVLINERLD
jgi:hypothetical protein